MKTTVLTFRKMKRQGEKISMLTCYDYTTARLMDGTVDGILVGDSYGNTMLGYDSTLPVTMDHLIAATQGVVRGCKESLVVFDMPFMSYQVSVEQALKNAGRALKETGCQAVKLEGGASVCPQIAALSHAGIPVVAHIGLTPQSVNALGGNRVQGKTGEAAERLIEDARKVEEAGAFAVVLECIPAPVAERISREVNIPTIGIGAGAGCDGQILVYQDMLGMNETFKPKFVKRYAALAEEMRSAFREYTADVKGGRFPEASHQFEMSSEEELKKLY